MIERHSIKQAFWPTELMLTIDHCSCSFDDIPLSCPLPTHLGLFSVGELRECVVTDELTFYSNADARIKARVGHQ